MARGIIDQTSLLIQEVNSNLSFGGTRFVAFVPKMRPRWSVALVSLISDILPHGFPQMWERQDGPWGHAPRGARKRSSWPSVPLDLSVWSWIHPRCLSVHSNSCQSGGRADTRAHLLALQGGV